MSHARRLERAALVPALLCILAPPASFADEAATASHVARVRHEIDHGLNERAVTDRLDRYHKYIAKLLDKSHAVLPPQVHEVLDPYIHSLDQRLGEHGHTAHHHDEPASTGEPRLIPVEELLQAFDRDSDDLGTRR